MKRNDFLKNALMAIAISLVPKILQPLLPEVTDEMIQIPVNTWVVAQNNADGSITYKQGELQWVNFLKKDVEFIEKDYYRIKVNQPFK